MESDMRQRFIRGAAMAEKAIAQGFNLCEGERILTNHLMDYKIKEQGFIFDTNLSNRELENLGIRSSSICSDLGL